MAGRLKRPSGAGEAGYEVCVEILNAPLCCVAKHNSGVLGVFCQIDLQPKCDAFGNSLSGTFSHSEMISLPFTVLNLG